MIYYLSQFGQCFVDAAIVFFFIWAAKKIADWRTPFDDDHEIEEKSNLSIGCRRGGLTLGIAIAMAGALQGSSLGFAADIVQLLKDGVVVLIAMFLARFINDALILRGINNDNEAKNGNVAVGLVELGTYIATGLIISGAVTGEGGGIPSVALFFILGELVLLFLVKVYEWITPFNVVEEIKSGNNAAGVAVAGMIIALGIILRASIAGPFVSWTADITSFLIYAVYGVVLLLISRKIIDWFLLPSTTLETEVKRDRNVAALVLTAGGVIAVAFVVASVI